MILGGTQSGKSTTAKAIVANVLRRESPINDRLEVDTRTGERTRDRWRPLTVWVGTPIGEKFRRDWHDPAHGESLRYWLGDLYKDKRESPDLLYYSQNDDQVIQKSYDQGVLPWESSVVDVVVMDEEPPDVRIVNAALGRLATTNGTLVLAFTPLEGMSWSFHKWYQPCVELGLGQHLGDRYWQFFEVLDRRIGRSVSIVQMGTADNPKARDYDRELETDPTMGEAEKQARRFGRYGFVQGLHFPDLAGFNLLAPNADHAPYVLTEDDQLPWIQTYFLIADPNYRHGAALVALDGDGNRFILRSHLQEAWSTRQHAEVFKEWIRNTPRRPRLYADMGSAGKQAKCDLNDLGLAFSPIVKRPGSIAASIKTIRGWLYKDPKHRHPITGDYGAPRLYFHRPGLVETWEQGGMLVTGSRLVTQLATAKRATHEGAHPDSLQKTRAESMDLLDCVRYAALVIPEVPDQGRPGERQRDRAYRESHLPTAGELVPAKRTVDPLDEELYVPSLEETWS